MRIGEPRTIEIGVPAPPVRRREPKPIPPPSRPAPVKEPEKVGVGSLQPMGQGRFKMVSVSGGCPQCGRDLEYITLEDQTTLVRCPVHGTLGGIQ